MHGFEVSHTSFSKERQSSSIVWVVLLNDLNDQISSSATAFAR